MRHTPAPLLALLPTLALSAAAAPPLEWRTEAAYPGLGAALAVAADASGRTAVGGPDGAWLRRPPEPGRRVLRRGPVRDLRFAPDGSLWAATDQGLFRVDAQERVSDRTPGPGAAARRVHRIVLGEGWALAATQAGVFARARETAWRRLTALPHGPVRALAAREQESGLELWAIVEGAAHRARLTFEDGLPRVARSLRVRLAEDGGAREAVDVLLGPAGGEVALLLRRGLALLRRGDWRGLRPPLPVGAEPRRLARAGGRLWIATDRGLVGAPGPEGPWARAASPAGHGAIEALAARGPELLAAGARGVLVGRRAASRVGPLGEAARLLEEPSVVEVQRAALRYLDLQPSRMRKLAKRVARRGWLPRLELRGAWAREDSEGRDLDEIFSSGALRRLRDRDRGRDRDASVGVVLSWDLGDTLYHPEAIDVSRETREWIELRDDVLDEINQLYFERRRVIQQLAALPQGDVGEAARLRLRADELAAGLDAWTGDWFGRRALSFASPGSGAP